jgi:membrane-associated phospholipid phosphatase
MSLLLLLSLVVAAGVMMLIERAGVRTTLQLKFKGDVKRETAFLAQWGQSVATPLVSMVIWWLDPPRRFAAWLLLAAVLTASITCFVLKRLLGRVRPNRPDAGKFLGPSLKHENYRESFPSSHSACAIACSVYIAALYPPIAWIMWMLGLITATLRYLLDAHWPSDVIAGIAIGYFSAHLWLNLAHPPPFAH